MQHFARLLPALSLAAIACGELTSADLDRLAPRVRALSDLAVAGELVWVELENSARIGWVYEACPGTFEQKVGEDWVEVPPALVACTAMITTIDAQETKAVGLYLPNGLEPGEYRAVVRFSYDGRATKRTSGPFEVVRSLLAEGPVVTVTASAVLRGTDAPVAFSNPTPAPFGFNLCSDGRLERRVGNEWVLLPEPFWVCTQELQLLGVGGTWSGSYPVLPDVVPGTYRLRVRFHGAGFGDAISHSNSFTVE